MTTGAVPSEHPFNRARRQRFGALLLEWFDRQKRDLPWRRTRDPYAIWLSEVMLQQTTVRTVEPRWQRFLDRWPTIRQLAAAPLDDVLHEWTGLGYYARARNLHRAAKVADRDFGGVLPTSYEMLLALPGMGVYTAAAVASIAFGEAVPVLDANVERVLTRLIALEENARSTAAKRRLRTIAGELLVTPRAGDFNQAMMELGALTCLPKKPRCRECPVATLCRAHQLEAEERYPVLPKKQPLQPTREVAVIIRNEHRVLLLRRHPEVSFGGMWELPRVTADEAEDVTAAALRAGVELAGLTVTPRAPVLKLRHVVMRRSIELTVVDVATWQGTVMTPEHADFAWRTPAEWIRLPKSTTQADIAEFLATGRAPKRLAAPSTSEPEPDIQPDLFGEG